MAYTENDIKSATILLPLFKQARLIAKDNSNWAVVGHTVTAHDGTDIGITIVCNRFGVYGRLSVVEADGQLFQTAMFDQDTLIRSLALGLL